jgi:hypothetical protein
MSNPGSMMNRTAMGEMRKKRQEKRSKIQFSKYNAFTQVHVIKLQHQKGKRQHSTKWRKSPIICGP